MKEAFGNRDCCVGIGECDNEYERSIIAGAKGELMEMTERVKKASEKG